MKNAIIIHGMPDKEEYYSDKYPSASNFQWLPWLQKQLLMRDIFAVTPEMPRPYEPEYKTWKREFERHEVTSETVLVGHSCGGGFLVRWLSEHPDVKTGKVFLVAPWINPDKNLKTGFFDFTIDPSLGSRTDGIVLYVSNDDDADIQESVKILEESISDISIRKFIDRGHFLTPTFTELRDDILNHE